MSGAGQIKLVMGAKQLELELGLPNMADWCDSDVKTAAASDLANEDAETFEGDLMAMAIAPCWLWTVICAATNKR